MTFVSKGNSRADSVTRKQTRRESRSTQKRLSEGGKRWGRKADNLTRWSCEDNCISRQHKDPVMRRKTPCFESKGIAHVGRLPSNETPRETGRRRKYLSLRRHYNGTFTGKPELLKSSTELMLSTWLRAMELFFEHPLRGGRECVPLFRLCAEHRPHMAVPNASL